MDLVDLNRWSRTTCASDRRSPVSDTSAVGRGCSETGVLHRVPQAPRGVTFGERVRSRQFLTGAPLT
jgi:hypothetical protein